MMPAGPRAARPALPRTFSILSLALADGDFGLCFINFSSYPPFNVHVWLNGHEWAKRQLDRRGVAYEDLDNGFWSTLSTRARGQPR